MEVLLGSQEYYAILSPIPKVLSDLIIIIPKHCLGKAGQMTEPRMRANGRDRKAAILETVYYARKKAKNGAQCLPFSGMIFHL